MKNYDYRTANATNITNDMQKKKVKAGIHYETIFEMIGKEKLKEFL